MKYISIFIMFSVMLAMTGCGKDVERKIEVTIKDSVNKNKEKKIGDTTYDCSADDMMNINITSKDDSLENIFSIIKKIHNVEIEYPDKLKNTVISIEYKNISLENLLDHIATKINATVDIVNEKYIFK